MSSINIGEALLRQIIREELQDIIPESESFLSAEKAAAYLGYSLHTLYRLTSKKELPFYKISGHLLFKEAELLDYVVSGKSGGKRS